MRDDAIVQCVIHPGIGIARVGNSPDEYLIGPELPGVVPNPQGGFKDAQGRIKRQVARFRIYGLDRAGNVIKEVTARDAAITWTVHVANKKAAWYTFDLAMDIPQAKPCPRRNAYLANDRAQLIIDPGPRSVSGPNERAVFDTGTFLGINVPLGEIRTDGQGNLLVFGGFGRSETPYPERPATTFANNDGWHDDISDGPVHASVILDGEPIPVTPAWVIVGPPDYAPAVQSVVTLYDVVYEAATKIGQPLPAHLSFTEHIYPIFRRFCIMEWVNEGFYIEYGFGSGEHFLAPALLAQLADNGPKSRVLRNPVLERFRPPEYRHMQPNAWPPMYGDGMDLPPTNARQWMAMTSLQYGILQRWAEGDFIPDWRPDAPATPRTLEDLPIADRPRALDRASLEACLGGPFHPGCEATWPMRHPMLYSAPFRIKERPEIEPERDYGETLTPEVALAPNGPLNGSGPGDITRWMGVPWQTDTASCGAGYTPGISSSLPTFWPARVPNHVLRERSYQQVMNNARLSPAQRMKYFSLRENWLRDLSTVYERRINQFVREWHKVGIIVHRDGPLNDPNIPSDLYVETENEFEQRPDGRHLLHDPRTGR